MTTAETETLDAEQPQAEEATLPTVESVLPRLRALDATDPDTVVGISPSQRRTLEERHHRRHGCLFALESTLDLLVKPQARLAEFERQRPIVAAAEAALVSEMSAAMDWRTLPTGLERDREFKRQEALKMSLQALQRGCEFFNGEPCVPPVLLEHLGGTWYGSLPALDDRIAECKARIAVLQTQLNGQLTAAEALIAEAATV